MKRLGANSNVSIGVCAPSRINSPKSLQPKNEERLASQSRNISLPIRVAGIPCCRMPKWPSVDAGKTHLELQTPAPFPRIWMEGLPSGVPAPEGGRYGDQKARQSRSGDGRRRPSQRGSGRRSRVSTLRPALSAALCTGRNRNCCRSRSRRPQTGQRGTSGWTGSDMKCGPTRQYGNDFVFEAYVNYRTEAIYLAGLPNIPESRPHSEISETNGWKGPDFRIPG